MANLKFDGEYKDLSEIQNNFIREVLRKRGYEDNKVLFAPAGKAGDNYGSSVLRITTVVENGDNFKMIAKIAPKHPNRRAELVSDGSFNNEATMYSEVLPKLVSLQKAAGVPEEEILRYAECYGCLREVPHEVILLEDLKLRNFTILDRMKPFNNDKVQLVLKNFALLHSLCAVLKNREPETYNALKIKLKDLWVISNNRLDSYNRMKTLEEEIIAILNDDYYKNYIRGLVSICTTEHRRITHLDQCSKYSVIIQGDAWTSNIMFQENLKSCIMVDYQISQEANPVCDILYMIFNCTDHETRVEHFLDWLDYYYKEFDKSLNYFGMKAIDIYPKEELDADIRRYVKIYFGRAMILLSVSLRGSEEIPVVKDAGDNLLSKFMIISALSPETLAVFKSRVEGLIDTCEKFGLLRDV